MDRVEEWIGVFYARHVVRCPREDWPAPGTEDEATTVDAWRHAFVTRGVEFRFADVASLDMAGDPPRFLSDHLPAIVKLAIEMRARDDAGTRADPLSSPDAARIASKDCPDCRGSGFAVRYVHEEIQGKVKTSGGGIAPVGMGVGYPCSCSLGNLTAHSLRQPGQERDPLTVDQYPSLRLRPVAWSAEPDNQFRHRPSEWDGWLGVPSGSAEAAMSSREELLDGLKASLAASKSSRGRFVPPPPREPRPGEARALPARSEMADAIPDPVIERERASKPVRPAEPKSFNIPEDFIAF